jgi:acetyl-CoA carboxylase carboxyltransferase component
MKKKYKAFIDDSPGGFDYLLNRDGMVHVFKANEGCATRRVTIIVEDLPKKSKKSEPKHG